MRDPPHTTHLYSPVRSLSASLFSHGEHANARTEGLEAWPPKGENEFGSKWRLRGPVSLQRNSAHAGKLGRPWRHKGKRIQHRYRTSSKSKSHGERRKYRWIFGWARVHGVTRHRRGTLPGVRNRRLKTSPSAATLFPFHVCRGSEACRIRWRETALAFCQCDGWDVAELGDPAV